MKSRVYVDFNEMISAEEVLLSRTDSKMDTGGNLITFIVGLSVAVYMDDVDEKGDPDNLIANGIVARNTEDGWSSSVPWVLKIDDRGIRHLSEEPDQ